MQTVLAAAVLAVLALAAWTLVARGGEAYEPRALGEYLDD